MIHGSGIDPGEWAEADAGCARAALSIPPGAQIVLSVTAHCRDKGSFTLLDSCMNLWEQGQDFILVMAGPVMEDFRKYLDGVSPGIPDGKLVVTGYVSEELRKDLFTAAAVLAAPSRLDAFGIVLLDGWISGTPVIGCNAGGMPDIIENGKDGCLVEFGDAVELSARISELLGDRPGSLEMARRGREKTLEKYTWKKVTGRFYRELEKRGLCRE
jgi:glycosyltransferase involved in cell wall biosynthesis